MTIWDGHNLIKQDKSEVSAAEVVNNAEVIALYFSAHWCPPCRGFTPALEKFYEDNKADGLVIIFVSSDRDEASMFDYFSKDHGDYYAVKFSDSALAQELKKGCGVTGIPMLAIVNKEGKMLHGGGRGDVTSNAKGALKAWKKL